MAKASEFREMAADALSAKVVEMEAQLFNDRLQASGTTVKALLEEGLNSTGPNNGGRNEGDALGAIAKAAKKT